VTIAVVATAVLGLGPLTLAQPAGARDVTRAELRALAAAAQAGDASALAELRRVDTVAGRPVDLERALRGARGEELARRLATLGRPTGAAAGTDAAAARVTASDILEERRFREAEPPRPFRGPLEWLSERVRAAADAIGRALEPVADRLPGGGRTLWGVAALVVLVAAALAARRLVDRRAGAAAGDPHGREPRDDPARLEREADEAERRGELERALRLRFRAGLLRLQQARVVRHGDSVTTGEVARRLRSRDFEAVATAFDEVVYGRRPAEHRDVDRAREGWARVLAETHA
jgi:hypothetical protein